MNPTGQPGRAPASQAPTGAVEDACVPPTAGLTTDQLRGVNCVWCGEKLGLAVVDLGVRPDPQCPWASWFPRSCPPCHRPRSTGGSR
ncbi:hypothetical protein G3I57_21900 [Streptomyces albidoflavus]|uniref:Uncharacterized protein n=1 Tax=Streptomyces albidoflavus TaxID=1886 RepID=A0AA37FCA8_9ACTN|nr:hypothetical protein [Streptomyces albidoflavus]RZE41793.1 hypothetical protein C0Q91_11485 [Streptomyces albidoflavus]RZE58252.1 hypothetical protein C0Q97_11475 [Streptomyces albidoflavus]GHI46262.1 hypothetical protein ScoT_24360 [Streptomyces albidoflavus]